MVKLSRAICILGFYVWCSLFTVKYDYFGFWDWDFALYSQTMWALCHGTTYTSLFGTSFLADHAHYIAFLIAPLYFIFPHPLTLLYLEAFSFFVGAYFLYKLAERLTSPGTALILMLIYIFHPANIFMLLYEFHFECLAVALIFMLFYFREVENYTAFLITAVVLMLVKENMPAIVFMAGIYGLVFKNGKRIQWGLVPASLGLGTFLFIMFVLTPMVRSHLTAHQSIYWGLFSPLGKTPAGILKNLILHPLMLVKPLLTPMNLYFIRELTGGFLLGALFSPCILLTGFPLLLENLLSQNYPQHTIFYHYTATLVPFAAVAAAYGFAGLKRNYSRWFCRACLVISLLAACCDFVHYSHTFYQKATFCINDRAFLRQAFVDKIPPDAGVITNFVFLSHLSQRPQVYTFYNVWEDINYFTGQHPFTVPSSVRYALIDPNEIWLTTDRARDKDIRKINEFLANGGWKPAYARSGIVLYAR